MRKKEYIITDPKRSFIRPLLWKLAMVAISWISCKHENIWRFS